MKKGLFILLTYLIYNFATGQDIIYKNDGTEIKSIVVEITSDAVKCKNYEQPDSPIRSILINELFIPKDLHLKQQPVSGYSVIK
jgi:hypothetical protein